MTVEFFKKSESSQFRDYCGLSYLFKMILTFLRQSSLVFRLYIAGSEELGKAISYWRPPFSDLIAQDLYPLKKWFDFYGSTKIVDCGMGLLDWELTYLCKYERIWNSVRCLFLS